MIEIKHKEDCTGCCACAQRCPHGCISMREDPEGFPYPEVDRTRCTGCGLCERVCPVLHRSPPRVPLSSYAAVNMDESVRLSSSSGGVFSALASGVLGRGGVVFGARFDERWEVCHGWTETVAGLAAFRGSKYAESRIGTSYADAERFLRSGREVLFSGTPCQVAGLLLYLRRPYASLLTVDFICHGVPSPGVWRGYLSEEVARQCDKNTVSPPVCPGGVALVEGISMRDKSAGWKKFSFSLSLSLPSGQGAKNSVFHRELLTRNAYLRGFLSDLYLRPSCHACPVKSLRSGSDVTLGDYWGVSTVHPSLDDDKGVSAVLCNTARGASAVGSLPGVRLVSTRYRDVARLNPALLRSARVPRGRARFFAMGGTVRRRVNRLCFWKKARRDARSVARSALSALGLLALARRVRGRS